MPHVSFAWLLGDQAALLATHLGRLQREAEQQRTHGYTCQVGYGVTA